MSSVIIPQIKFAYNAAYDLIYQELFNAKKRSGEVVALAGVARDFYPTAAEIKEKKLELTNWRDLHGTKMLEMIGDLLEL